MIIMLEYYQHPFLGVHTVSKSIKVLNLNMLEGRIGKTESHPTS